MNFRHINILALSCITAAMSCVQVKTYDPDSVTGTAQVSFSAEWPDASGYYPETLDIAVARTVNSVHYVYEWPSETEGTVRAGDYHVTAFVADKDIYSLQGALDHFMSDPSYSMKNVSVALRQTDAPAIGGETEGRLIRRWGMYWELTISTVTPDHSVRSLDTLSVLSSDHQTGLWNLFSHSHWMWRTVSGLRTCWLIYQESLLRSIR